MNKLYIAAFVALSTMLQACVWVKPTSSGNAVRVAYNGDVGGCRDAGEISVSVADKVAFYHRPQLKVRDELETLARNQAAEIPADTIKASSEPHDGTQTFEAYVCGSVRVHAHEADAPAAPKAGEAETFPVKPY